MNYISDSYGFEYDVKATKTGSSPPLQWFGYKFDEGTGNLYSRKDVNRDKEEIFGYDLENRLLSVNDDELTMEYDIKGNITGKSDVSMDYVYDDTRPNAIWKINSPISNINQGIQNIEYNSFNKIKHIDELNQIDGSDDYDKIYKMNFSYGPEGERNKVVFKKDNDVIFTKYYSINYEEIHKPNNEIKKIHYIGGGNSLAAIYIIDENNNGQMYYMLTDHLGSITGLIDETTGDFAANNGNKQEFSYDAWGRRRNPDTWQCYDFILLTQQFNNSLISRGYTGHEHMDMFALINMNGRLYDPILGRVLSPDNYVQNPESSQGFNRYSYCGNNPLIYVDPDGDNPLIIIGAIIGGINGWMIADEYGKKGKFWYALAGASIGAATAGIGSAVSASSGVVAGGIIGGAVGGASFGTMTGYAAGLKGINLFNAGFMGMFQGAATGFAGSMVGGAVGGGWGALAGGATAGALGTLMSGGSGEDILKGAVLGGFLGWGSYHASLAYSFYKSGFSEKGLKYNQYAKMMAITQRSIFWNREGKCVPNSKGGINVAKLGGRNSVGSTIDDFNNALFDYHTHQEFGYDHFSTIEESLDTYNTPIYSDEYASVQYDIKFNFKGPMYLGTREGNILYMINDFSVGRLPFNFSNIFTPFNISWTLSLFK